MRGTLFFVCWGLCGDLDFLSNEYKIAHFNGNSPCNYCACDRTEVCPVTAVGPHAPWIPTVYRLGSVPLVPSAHPVWGIHGVRRFHVQLDLMHSGNLGVLAYLLASVIDELLDEGTLVGRRSERLDTLWSMILEAYTVLNISQHRIVSVDNNMFGKPGQFPVMSTKAIENRYLLKAMIHVCRRLSADTDHDQIRIACLESGDSMYRVIEEADMFLTDQEHRELMRHTHTFMLTYNWLANYSVDHGALRFHMTFKMHTIYHIADLGRYLNPRYVWCFAFEDYMGDAVKAARACVASCAYHALPAKILDNILLLLHVNLTYGDW